jgi:hypothetical protein
MAVVIIMAAITVDILTVDILTAVITMVADIPQSLNARKTA